MSPHHHLPSAVRPPRRRARPGRLAAAAASTALVLAAGAAAGPAAASAPEGPRPAVVPASKQIASTVLGADYRLTLTAIRSASDPLAASVRLAVYRHAAGGWKLSDAKTVGGAGRWFWYPLTGGHAVCSFAAGSTDRAPVAVSLLVTPAIGCSATQRWTLSGGVLTPAQG